MLQMALQAHQGIATAAVYLSLSKSHGDSVMNRLNWRTLGAQALIMLLEADAKDADILQRALVVLTKVCPR